LVFKGIRATARTVGRMIFGKQRHRHIIRHEERPAYFPEFCRPGR
jgi:hypothetical protein